MFRQFFPKGIAKGEPFFNRHDDVARLIGNIENNVHSVLMAPRRYGKSSLAKYVLQKMDILHKEIDLFVVINDMDIGDKIISAASEIIQQISSEPEQWFKSLREYFNQYDKKWTIGIKGVKLELTPHDVTTVPQNVLDVLQALEYMLKKQTSKAVIFIDEFQEVAETPSGKAIEGAIRHFAQESTHTVFVFSGSNRKLLKKIFHDRSRPLYALCDEIRLERISTEHYVTYLQNVAKKTYKKLLPPASMETILALSDRHPRYVYQLCYEVWLKHEKNIPSAEDIEQVWHDYVIQKYKDVRFELSSRSHTQIQLMTEIAKGKRENLSSKENLLSLGMTSSTVVQALKVLEELDYIERLDTGAYRIIDPLIKSSLLYAYGR